jgi:hypothetical protein
VIGYNYRMSNVLAGIGRGPNGSGTNMYSRERKMHEFLC